MFSQLRKKPSKMGLFSKKSKSMDITHPPLSPPCACPHHHPQHQHQNMQQQQQQHQHQQQQQQQPPAAQIQSQHRLLPQQPQVQPHHHHQRHLRAVGSTGSSSPRLDGTLAFPPSPLGSSAGSMSSASSTYASSSVSSERSSSESEAPPQVTFLSPPPAPRKEKSQNFTKEDQMQIVDKIYWEAIDEAKVGAKSCWARDAPRGCAHPTPLAPLLEEPATPVTAVAAGPGSGPASLPLASSSPPFTSAVALRGSTGSNSSTSSSNSSGSNSASAAAAAVAATAALQREIDDLVPMAERLVIEASKPAVAYIARASRLVKEARHMQSHMDRPDELEPAIYEMEEKLLRVSGLVGLLVAARGKMEWPESRRYPGRWSHHDGKYDITASLVIDDNQTFPYGFNIKSEGPGLHVGCAQEEVTCVVNGI